MLGKVKVAIMGAGGIAATMAKTVKKAKGVTLYAVGSRSLEKAEQFAKDHNIKKFYGSYEELVMDPKVDLVYIATPNSEHFGNAKLCIEHGKAVLCEKPFMLNEKEAKKIFKLADEKKVFVGEAIWTRFMPFNQTIKDLIAGGAIGEPAMLSANLSYNLQTVQRINEPSLGGGALLDLGVYPLNFASIFFGDEITDISSMATYNMQGVDIQDSITLRYRDGRMAVLNVSARAVGDRFGVIQGSKGYMVIDNINNPESLTVYDGDGKKANFYKRPRQHTGYEYEVEAAAKAIKKGLTECEEMPHAETLRIMNMMDFIRHQTGVQFPQEKPIEDVPENIMEQDALPVPENSDMPGIGQKPAEEIGAEEGTEKDVAPAETTPAEPVEDVSSLPTEGEIIAEAAIEAAPGDFTDVEMVEEPSVADLPEGIQLAKDDEE